jgi:hypothetical protein
LCFSLSVSGNSQCVWAIISSSSLTGKEWVNRIPGKTYYDITQFTDKEYVINGFIDDVNETIEIKDSYYLSDTVVTTFQPDLAGKSKSGKYIVVWNKGKASERLEMNEILELTDTVLKTKHVRSDTVLEYRIE